jgi:hypothetical protein
VILRSHDTSADHQDERGLHLLEDGPLAVVGVTVP